VAGIILMAGFYTSVFLQIRQLPRGPAKTFFQGLLIFVLIRGLADTEPFDLSLPLWFVCLITPVLMQWAAQPHERQSALATTSPMPLVPLPEEPLL
jgi:exopolysaccharide production protein ExoQ